MCLKVYLYSTYADSAAMPAIGKVQVPKGSMFAEAAMPAGVFLESTDQENGEAQTTHFWW